MKWLLLTVVLLVVLASSAHAEKLLLVTNDDLKEPFGTAFDSKGAMYVIEMAEGNRLLKIDDKGKATHGGCDRSSR